MTENKRERRKDARPSEILNAAADKFLTNGFSKTTLLDIAKAAGISRSTIYLYYKTKEELFLQVVRATVKNHSIAIQKAQTTDSQDVKEKIKTIVDLIYTITGDERYLKLLLIFITESANNPFLKQIFFSEIFGKITQPTKELLIDARETQNLSDITLTMIAGSFFISSLSSMILTEKESFLPSRLTLKEALPKLLLNSLLQTPLKDAKE